MQCNYTVDDDGRLAGLALGVYNSEAPVIDLPDDFDTLYMRDYRVVDGQLVHDPLPKPEPEPSETEIMRQQIEQLQAQINILIGGGD